MKIVILGASGKTGRQLVAQALDAGHEVTAVVRSPEKMKAKHSKLRIVKGNAKDAGSLEAAFVGNEAVVTAVGISVNGRDFHLMRGMAEAVDRAAQATGLKRVVIMTSFVALPDQLSKPVRLATKLGMGKIIADIQDMKRFLSTTNLNWTVVYATRLTENPRSGQVRVIGPGEKAGAGDSIARADAAGFMLRLLDDGKFVKQSVLITGKM